MNDFNRGQQHEQLMQEQEGPSWREVNKLRAEVEQLRALLAEARDDLCVLHDAGELIDKIDAALANHEREPGDEKRS